MKPQRSELFFVHLPSCGGITFWRILESIYGPESIVHWWKRELDDPAFMTGDDDRTRCAGKAVLGGHLPHPRARLLFPGRQFITFLRDPVERAISIYSRRVRRGHWTPSPERGERDIIDFWKQRHETEPHARTQCARFFGPSPETPEQTAAWRSEISHPSVESVSQVLENDFLVFGITDQFDRSLRLMGKHLGWPRIPRVHPENVGPNRPRFASAETREWLAGWLAEECAIYRRALKIFTDRCRESEIPNDSPDTIFP